MDQGLTKNRLWFSWQKHKVVCILLIIIGAFLMGGWNVYKQWKAIRTDRAILQEMEESLQSSKENSEDSEEASKTERTPEQQREQNALNWADLQVQYYDSRVAALINANREIAHYFQNSLLRKGNLMDMPCYQIRFSLKHMLNPAMGSENVVDFTRNFNTTSELYQSDSFYAQAKQILGNSNLSEVFIDELINMNYDPLTGIVSLKAYHPDEAVAQKLARIAFEASYQTLMRIGFGDTELTRLDDGAHREAMNALNTKRRELLRDMKTNQDELTLLQGQEPPRSQQKKTDQKILPTARSFQLRSLALNLVIGALCGAAVAVLLVVGDAVRLRNVLFAEDYSEDGASAVVSWGKKNVDSCVLTLREAADVAHFLKEFYAGEADGDILLLTPQSLENVPEFTSFAQSLYPTDGSMVLRETWKKAHKIVLFAPAKSLTRKEYEPLKTALTLVHQKIDAVVLMHAKA